MVAFKDRKDTEHWQFTLDAIVLWIVHDYPKYSLFFGCSHQGYASCVWCGPNTWARHSLELNKCMHIGHWRYIAREHLYRRRNNISPFDNDKDDSNIPANLMPKGVWAHLEASRVWAATPGKPANLKDPFKYHGVKRKSIFYELPYWKVSAMSFALQLFLSYHSTTVTVYSTTIFWVDVHTPQIIQIL